MTDAIRDLLISLASHMAYMQGQLESRHGLDDFEDFYWCRESVLLRQKVTDALEDEPAVPEGREPAAVLARWGNLKARVTSSIPADGEVAELVAWLQNESHHHDLIGETLLRHAAELLQRQVLVPVPVSERLPGPEDFDEKGRCWCFGEGEDMVVWTLQHPSEFYYYSATHWLPAHALPVPEVK